MKRFISLLAFLLVSLSLWADRSDLITQNSAGADISFSTSGTSEWKWDSGLQRLLSSNSLTAHSVSTTSITFAVGGPCRISFNYECQCDDPTGDRLLITLDDTPVVDLNDLTSSQYFSEDLSAGTHTLVLSYANRAASCDGADYAMVCDMRLVRLGHPLFGDYDGDGRITVADLTHLTNMFIGKEPRKFLVEGQLVDEILVSSVALDHRIIQAQVGTSVVISASCLPANAFDKTISWSSSDPEVATVDQYGKVEIVSLGSATITAKASDRGGAEQSCSVEGVTKVDPYYGHSYVDMGMKIGGRTVLWATRNVGAARDQDPGLFFAWGSTEGFGSEVAGSANVFNEEPVSDGHLFDWSSVPFNGGSSDLNNSLVRINRDEICPDGFLAPAYDAARANWGGEWRMPTRAELEWLCDKNNCTWAFIRSRNAFLVTSLITDKSIFIPITGSRCYDYIHSRNLEFILWSSNDNIDHNGFTYSLRGSLESSTSYPRISEFPYYYGLQIRPVCDWQ